MKRIKNMKRFLICLISFLFIGCSIAGGAVVLSNISASDEYRGGESPPDENDVTKNEPTTTSGSWTTTGRYADSFADGDGSPTNPYQIATAAQLARLAYLINGSTSSSYRSLNYVQTSNIDLSQYYWTRIGYSSSRYFSGNYDGGGYIISGLFINSSTLNYQGLFGYVIGSSTTNMAKIHDFSISNSSIQGYRYVGGIVGYSQNLDIYNCNYSGGIFGYDYTGGILGYVNSSSNITNCYNTANISCDGSAGGVIGHVYSGAVVNIDNCYNSGNIASNNSSAGITYDGYANDNLIITNCYNLGNITLTGNSSDGQYYSIAGIGRAAIVENCFNAGTITNLDGTSSGISDNVFENCSIINCYNIGTIISSGDYDAAGITTSNQGVILCCYNEGDVSGGHYVAGICAYSSDGYIQDCYNTGDITNSNNYAGGIIGYSRSSDITNCYNIGEIDGSRYVGGIAGRLDSSSLVSNCYNAGNVLGNNYTAAVVGYSYSSTVSYCRWGVNCTLSSATGYGSSSNCSTMTETQAKTQSWYTTFSNWNSLYPWDFETVWGFVAGKNDGYPILIDAQYTIIEYHSNYGTETIIYDYHMGDEPIEIYGDIFTRDGYIFVNWNTNANGTGTSYEAGQTYSGNTDLVLYAQWRLPIFEITLDWTGIVGGSPNTIYLWYSDSYYSDEGCTNAISRLSYPTNNGYTFRGFFSGMNGTGTQFVDSSGNFLTYTTMTTTWHAYFVANNPAYYDSEGGYWYIENGYMPQSRVTNTTTWNYLNSNWSSLSNVRTYYMDALTSLSSKEYGGKEYCKYNDEYYLVEPIRWRLDYNSNQTPGFGTETSTLAVMAKIVYVGRYSLSEINAGGGYQAFSVSSNMMFNRITNTYLANWTQSMPTFGSTSLNGASQSYTARMFVSSIEEIEAVAGSGKIEFSDLVKDYLQANGKDTLYFTRDLGTNYNNIWCMNANGDRDQYKANNYFGVQFTIKVTEYACV